MKLFMGQCKILNTQRLFALLQIMQCLQKRTYCFRLSTSPITRDVCVCFCVSFSFCLSLFLENARRAYFRFIVLCLRVWVNCINMPYTFRIAYNIEHNNNRPRKCARTHTTQREKATKAQVTFKLKLAFDISWQR